MLTFRGAPSGKALEAWEDNFFFKVGAVRIRVRVFKKYPFGKEGARARGPPDLGPWAQIWAPGPKFGPMGPKFGPWAQNLGPGPKIWAPGPKIWALGPKFGPWAQIWALGQIFLLWVRSLKLKSSVRVTLTGGG